MPTRHYTIDAEPAEALEQLRTAALASDWHVDKAAGSPTLLVLKRGASETTWGYSVSILVTDFSGDSTTLVATTDDVQHDSDYLHESGDLHRLFKAVGASHA